MTGVNPAPAASIATDPDVAQRRHARTEATIVLLQTAVAVAFIAGAYAGLFHVASPIREITAAWLWLYHVWLTVYSFKYRVHGQSLAWVEPLIPLLDLSCATAVYISLGDPVSPVWAIYLYALIGYSRRYEGRGYLAVSGYTILNLLVGWLAIGNPKPAQFFIMLVISVAVMTLASPFSESWREAARRGPTPAKTAPLPGLATRRTFFERLAQAGRMPLSILMLDLDHFKKLNDEFGHLRGDEVLRAAAAAMASSVPSTAITARFGGEEFIVALPGIDARQAGVFGESIRQSISAATPTTVSIGCTVLRPFETIDQAIRRADELLYVAKRQGRDRVARDAFERYAA